MAVGRQRSDEYDMGKMEAQVAMMSARFDRMEDDIRKIFDKLDLISQQLSEQIPYIEQCKECPKKWDSVHEEISSLKGRTSSGAMSAKILRTVDESRAGRALEKSSSSTGTYWKNHPKFAEVLMDGVMQGFKLLVAAGMMAVLYLGYTMVSGGNKPELKVPEVRVEASP